MRCEKVQPVGEAVVRMFDEGYCIVAKKVFLVLFNGDVYGTTDFDSLQGYLAYVNAACECCAEACYFTVNCCFGTVNGCQLVFDTTEAPCNVYVVSCLTTINGNPMNVIINN